MLAKKKDCDMNNDVIEVRIDQKLANVGQVLKSAEIAKAENPLKKIRRALVDYPSTTFEYRHTYVNMMAKCEKAQSPILEWY